jgi:hypothetical protein
MSRLFFIISLFLISLNGGFFPPTVTATVTGVSGNSITISRAFPAVGMSGVVIHNYGNGLSAIRSIAISTSAQSARLKKGDLLDHNGLPLPKGLASVGDKVIAGYLYRNVLVIAPNAQTYSAITRSASRHWIHPDLYAAFLVRQGDSSISKSNLEKFAKEAQVGLVYIVKRGSAILYDPISKRVIAQKAFNVVGSEAKYPFYTRFTSLKSGFFGSSAKGDYYKGVGAIR